MKSLKSKFCNSQKCKINENVSKDAEKALFVSNKLWNANAQIPVFIDSSDEEIKSFIKDIVQRNFNENCSLNFIFQTVRENSSIRIQILLDNESWSYVGTDNLNIPESEYTMKLGDVGQDTILHEFGHAIGWAHEHQHPNTPFEYDRDAILQEMAPYGWTEEDVEINILNKMSNTDMTPYDEKSIMHYALPSHWVIPNTNFKDNVVLSEQDVFSLMIAYPKYQHLSISECDFCRPHISQLNLNRKLYRRTRIRFLNGTNTQQLFLRMCIRLVFLKYIPVTIEYVKSGAAEVRIQFGVNNENYSVCGINKETSDDLKSDTPTLVLAETLHLQIVLHQLGHMFGLRDRRRDASECISEERLVDFLNIQDSDPRSIMSIQSEYSQDPFMLHYSDRLRLQNLYRSGSELKENKNNLMYLFILIPIILIILVGILYASKQENNSNIITDRKSVLYQDSINNEYP